LVGVTVAVLILGGVFSGSVFSFWSVGFQGFAEAIQHGGDLFGFGDQLLESFLFYDADTTGDVKLGA